MSNNNQEYRYLYEDTLDHISLIVPGNDDLSETADARLFEAFEKKYSQETKTNILAENYDYTQSSIESTASTVVPFSITKEIFEDENNQTVIGNDKNDLISMTFLEKSPNKTFTENDNIFPVVNDVIFPIEHRSEENPDGVLVNISERVPRMKQELKDLVDSFERVVVEGARMADIRERLDAHIHRERDDEYKARYQYLMEAYNNREALYKKTLQEKDEVIRKLRK